MQILFKEKKKPYICTPLTGKNEAVILEQLEQTVEKQPDLIEWRADFFESLDQTESVLDVIHKIKITTTIPLLFTIRSEHEGGEKISLTEVEKVQLLSEVCERTDTELIDYETSNEKQYIEKLREESNRTGKKLILSYHHFGLTPENDQLIQIAQKAENYGADIVKFAVMPHNKADVLRLLAVTEEIDQLLDVPVISMSMGELGALSRVIGWAFGSIVTFAVGVELSAPGQIPIKELRETIQSVQHITGEWKSIK